MSSKKESVIDPIILSRYEKVLGAGAIRSIASNSAIRIESVLLRIERDSRKKEGIAESVSPSPINDSLRAFAESKNINIGSAEYVYLYDNHYQTQIPKISKEDQDSYSRIKNEANRIGQYFALTGKEVYISEEKSKKSESLLEIYNAADSGYPYFSFNNVRYFSLDAINNIVSSDYHDHYDIYAENFYNKIIQSRFKIKEDIESYTKSILHGLKTKHNIEFNGLKDPKILSINTEDGSRIDIQVMRDIMVKSIYLNVLLNNERTQEEEEFIEIIESILELRKIIWFYRSICFEKKQVKKENKQGRIGRRVNLLDEENGFGRVVLGEIPDRNQILVRRNIPHNPIQRFGAQFNEALMDGINQAGWINAAQNIQN